jgi:hypothetical protein
LRINLGTFFILLTLLLPSIAVSENKDINHIAMTVVDSYPKFWAMVEYDGKYYLDVNTGSGAIGYEITIRLNEEELSSYKGKGHEYATKLAYLVHYNNKKYLKRKINEIELKKLITRTIVSSNCCH